MSIRVYCALFMGQGGALTSWGMYWMASALRRVGAEAEVWRYSDYERASSTIEARRAADYRLALVGYSLGASAATYLQTRESFDLVVCVAESTLAANYRIDKRRTKRSVLLYSRGVLSSGGLDAGFDQEIEIGLSHLLMDLSPKVFDVVREEVGRLLK